MIKGLKRDLSLIYYVYYIESRLFEKELTMPRLRSSYSSGRSEYSLVEP